MNFRSILTAAVLIQCFFMQSAYAKTAQELFNEGNHLAEQGKYQEAIALYEDALKSKLGSNYQIALLHYSIGRSYTKLGNRAKSILSYTASINYYQDYPLTYLNRGNDYHLEGKVFKAIQDFDKAIALDDKLFFAYNSRAIAYLDLKETKKAKSDLNSAIRINPGYTNAYKNRARVYFQTKEFHLALSDIENAIKIGIKDAWPYNMAAWIYATAANKSLRNADRAVLYAQKALELKRNSQSFDTLAAAYAEQGKFDLAVHYQNQAIQMLSKNVKQKTVSGYNDRLKAYKEKEPWRDKSLM